MIHVLFIVIELQALLLSNNIIDAISVLLLFLRQNTTLRTQRLLSEG